MKKLPLFSVLIAASLLTSASCSCAFAEEAADDTAAVSAEISAIASAGVGDSVYFGTYEQDAAYADGSEAIEWIVLEKGERKTLLLSKDILDSQVYLDEIAGSASWQASSLRQWLNGEFFNEAFSTAEQEYIPWTDLSGAENSNPAHMDIPQANDTQDKVFLLSISEATTYFADDESRKCAATEWADYNGILNSADELTVDGRSTSPWLLRTAGFSYNYAALVNVDGSIDYEGEDVGLSGYGVRPAIWVTDAPVQAEEETSAVIDLASAGVGDIVSFGSYEQDADEADGTEAISWIVLDVNDGTALLISEYGLDSQPYDTNNADSYSGSSIRTWLNDTFLSAAFSPEEAEKIVVLDDTGDKVFFLDMQQASDYFADDAARVCYPTAYAISQGVWTNEEYIFNGASPAFWMLETPDAGSASTVRYDGMVLEHQRNRENAKDMVRPCIWVSIG